MTVWAARLGGGADLKYVRILHLAASTSETAVETALEDLLGRGELRDCAQVRSTAEPQPIAVPPSCTIEPSDLSTYDAITGLVGGEQ